MENENQDDSSAERRKTPGRLPGMGLVIPLLIVATIAGYMYVLGAGPPRERIVFSFFIEQLQSKNVEEVEIVGLKDTTKSVVTGVEMFKKNLDQGQAGDNVGILLRGIEREDIERGQVLCKPGTITPHTEFDAEVYILTKEEGGRHTPFFKGYKPQFYFRTTDVTGEVELPADKEMVMPGDNVGIEVELLTPIAMERTIRFAIREGGRTVGAGRVAEILD